MTAATTLPQSLYPDTARPGPSTPPLDGDRRAAVAIIGGGFTGLSAALRLAEQAVDVVLLEANEPGWGASGRNGGRVNPGLKHDPDQIERDFGSDLGARMIALFGAAPDFVFNLIRRLNLSPALRHVYDPTGGAGHWRYAERDRRARAAGWQPVGPDCRGTRYIVHRHPRGQAPYERVPGYAA